MSTTISRALTILGIGALLPMTGMAGLASTQQNVPPPAAPPPVHTPAPAAPQDLPDQEQGHAPQATPSGCPQTHVHNLTKIDVKVIYSWAGHHSAISTIKKGETVALPNTACITRLSVVTNGKTFWVDVNPGQDYDLSWSAEKKAYQIRETPAKPSGSAEKPQ